MDLFNIIIVNNSNNFFCFFYCGIENNIYICICSNEDKGIEIKSEKKFAKNLHNSKLILIFEYKLMRTKKQ